MGKSRILFLPVLIFALTACSITTIPVRTATPTSPAFIHSRPTEYYAYTAEPVVMCVIASDALNMRSGPGVQFSAIAWLTHGEKVYPTGTKAGKWWYVLAGHQNGWIMSSWIGWCK